MCSITCRNTWHNHTTVLAGQTQRAWRHHAFQRHSYVHHMCHTFSDELDQGQVSALVSTAAVEVLRCLGSLISLRNDPALLALHAWRAFLCLLSARFRAYVCLGTSAMVQALGLCSGVERERIMFITHLKPLQPKTAIRRMFWGCLQALYPHMPQWGIRYEMKVEPFAQYLWWRL
jgi:hypothetical protein